MKNKHLSDSGRRLAPVGVSRLARALCGPCLMLAAMLAVSGCFAISQAQRDSDEDQWQEQWGSDEVAPAKKDKKAPPPSEQPTAKPPVAGKQRVAEKQPVVEKKPVTEQKPVASKKTAADKPPAAEQPAQTAAAPPLVMYPSEVDDENADKKTGHKPEHKPEHKAEKPGPVKASSRTVVSPAVEPPTPPVAEADAGRYWVFLDARGGILINQKGKLKPAGFTSCGVDLGRLIGWRGLLAGIEADVSGGSDQLGNTDFVTLDLSLLLRGRIPIGPIRLLAGLGFVLRNAFVTGHASGTDPEPDLGLGVLATLGLELPVWGPLGVAIVGDGRYIKDPFTSKFVFSSGVGGGVTLEF